MNGGTHDGVDPNGGHTRAGLNAAFLARSNG
jgi:hypothetical protein